MTTPATCALPMKESSLYIMLPASISGAIKMSAAPATGEITPFGSCRLRIHGDIEVERPIDDSADYLPPIGHLGQRRGLHCGGHFGPHRFDS